MSKKLTEAIDVTGSKVFIAVGRIRPLLNPSTQRTGYMDLEEARRLLHAKIDKLKELSHQ